MARWVSERATRSASRMMLVALLGVLAVGVWGAFAVLAASAPSAPTITPTPAASPTSSATESLAFSSSGATSYQCSLNSSAFAVCTSPKVYGTVAIPQAQGSYSFQVKALNSTGNASSASTYAWVVDRTAPTVAAPVVAGSSPTNASSVSWTVTFSESVKNVVLGNFSLAATNLTGFSISGISGSGASYTVTATTGSLTNAASNGALRLDVANKGTGSSTITDLAGNVLSTPLPLPGASYAIDRTPPPAPTISSSSFSGSLTNQSSATFGFSDSESGVMYLCKLDATAYAACANPATFSGLADGVHTLTVEAKDAAGNVSGPSASKTWTVDTAPPPKPTIVGPNNNNPSTAATFTITDTEAGVSFKCRLDGSPYTACTSPSTYTLLTPGTHVFDAEPIDAAGNIGPYNEWTWTITGSSGSGQPFTITNPVLPPLYPGGATDAMNLSLTNPNSVTIYITNVTVSLSVTPLPSATGPNPCSTADFTLTQYSGGSPIVLPPGTKTLMQLGYAQAKWPSIKMPDRPLNQDRCKNATLNFTYGGSAQS